MRKHSGGARLDAQTFQASCAVADRSSATAWLQATHTLKGPDESAYDAFVHVMEGLFRTTRVVIKLQEVGRYSEREAAVADIFRRRPHTNVASLICEYKCRHDLLHWQNPIRTPMPLCNGEDVLLSVFVMEYIPYHLTETQYPSDLAFRSTLKQLGYTLMELHYEYGLTHGDIGSGNLMLDIGAPKTNTYTIGGQVRTVDTYGYEPILIDFQRSVPYSLAVREGPYKDDYPSFVVDEIATTYNIIGRWMNRRAEMDVLEKRLAAAETQADVLRIIDEI